MRSILWMSLLSLTLATGACKKKQDDTDEKPKKKSKKDDE